MTTAARQARWRANDTKAMIQIRLTPEAVERLDRVVQSSGMAGRAELVERLVMADPGERPNWVRREAVRLARSWFHATGQRSF